MCTRKNGVHIVHIFRRGQERRAGGGGEPPDVLIRFVVRGLCGQQGGDLGVTHAGQEVGVQGVPLRAELAPKPAPPGGLDGAARLQRLGEAQAGGADLVVDLDVLVDGQVQDAWRGIVLVDAAPAVFAGAAAEGRQAQVVAAADGLGVQAGQIVVARLGPGFGGSDAIGLGHDAAA
jgi:hypothetical protein